jgi:exosortase/archaeosortase family protein
MVNHDNESNLINYLFSYFLIFLIINFGFQFIPSRWLELITAQVSSNSLNILGLFSRYGIYNDNVYLTLEGGVRDVNVLIVRECTAIHVWGVLLGLVTPLRGEINRKMKSMVFGAILVFIMNIMRVLATIYFTGYNVPLLSWFFQNPTIETYHYPISFFYGVLGIMILIITIDRLFLPELGEFLILISKMLIEPLKKFFVSTLKEVDFQ